MAVTWSRVPVLDEVWGYMNVAPLIFGLLLAFLLIGLGVGALAHRWRPRGHVRRQLVIGVLGAYLGGFLLGLAPLNVEDGLIGEPLAAFVGSTAALLLTTRLMD